VSTPAPAAEIQRRETRSLRASLLLLVLPLIVVGLIAGGLGAYALSRDLAADSYDQRLFNAALAIGGQIHAAEGKVWLDIPVIAERMLRTRQVDTLFYQVRRRDGTVVGGEGEFPPPPVDAEIDPERGAALYRSVYKGLPVYAMVVEFPCGDENCKVIVGETTRKRERLAQHIVAGSLLPLVGLGALLLALIWFGIERGLFPLSRLSREIEARAPHDLRPIDPRHAPKEARAMVSALNGLLADVATLSGNQRRFLANAAHQLRTPLAGVLAHTELALAQPTGAALRRELEQIHRGARRSTRIANQLLALASAESGMHDTAAQASVDLDRLATGMVDDWVSRSLRAGSDIGFELESARVRCSAELVSEAMDNLVQNALEYSGAGRHVTVRTGTAVLDGTTSAYFEVEDDGPGIAVEERLRVRERFYRTPGTGGTGSGLGLAIVEETARAHGGRLTIDHGAGGRGCRVRLAFEAIEATKVK